MPKLKLIVDGGNMKPGPAVAQQLGPLGINLGKVTQDVNVATANFKGIKVPIELDVDVTTKNFTIQVFSPPVSELLKKELKIEKASGTAGKTYVGNLAIEQIISIGKTKMSSMLARDLKSAVKLVVGSCVSAGIMIESKNPIMIESEIDSGKYDSEIQSEKTEVPSEKKTELESFFKEIQTKQEAEVKAAEAAKAQEEATKSSPVGKPAESEVATKDSKQETKAPKKKA